LHVTLPILFAMVTELLPASDAWTLLRVGVLDVE